MSTSKYGWAPLVRSATLLSLGVAGGCSADTSGGHADASTVGGGGGASTSGGASTNGGASARTGAGGAISSGAPGSGGNFSSGGRVADAGTKHPDASAGAPSSGGAPDAASDDTVLPEDIVLTTPVPAGTILGTVTGYEVSSGCPMPKASYCESPIYSTYDRNTPAFWDVLVDEHLLSRVNVVMAHGRGCFDPNTGTDGNGNMCPRLLSNLVDAVHRAGADDVYRVGMWDDTGAYPGTRNHVDKLPDGTAFDLSDRTSWRFFWDHNMKIWHDTIPARLWYRLGGRPVTAFWSLSSAFFSHQQGNASALLRDLRAKFQARYGEDPLFILDETWQKLDSSITTDDAQGMDGWFVPPGNNYTYRDWAGSRWGAMVPGFRDPQHDPGCGQVCREVPRRDGGALRDALAAGKDAKFSLLEGWTDIFESAGYYRSAAWRFPNEYIGVVREFADPTPATLRFQAEGADVYSPSNGNGTASFRKDVTNIGKLADGTGWYVDWSQQGGYLEFSEVTLGCGTYRFTARAAALAAALLTLEVDGKEAGVAPLAAGGASAAYGLAHLATVHLDAGKHRIRLSSAGGGVNVDWFFLRRSASCR
jgi:hypothetical protein